jgi:hypothetical protein
MVRTWPQALLWGLTGKEKKTRKGSEVYKKRKKQKAKKNQGK